VGKQEEKKGNQCNFLFLYMELKKKMSLKIAKLNSREDQFLFRGLLFGRREGLYNAKSP
jgi:hypothetical protein